MSQRNPGFTLTELLVVIAIIALLAALLLPGLATSKTHAQQIGCLNNVRQITIAGLMYMSDGDTGFPLNDAVQLGYLPDVASGWEKAIIHYGQRINFDYALQLANRLLLFQPIPRQALPIKQRFLQIRWIPR
jgi:prepilin-type N-terminal cleavage/methylation domain-containing protein